MAECIKLSYEETDKVWDSTLGMTQREINAGESYSTDEIKTGGTWIDGKPIYKRVATFTNCTMSSETDLSSWNIDTMVQYDVLLSGISSGAIMKAPYYATSTDYSYPYWASTQKAFRHRTSAYPTERVVFYYTKTTD